MEEKQNIRPKKLTIPKKESIDNFPDKQKRIFLSNKDLMEEILNVKMSYSWLLDPKYKTPHHYILQTDEIEFNDSNPAAHAVFADVFSRLGEAKNLNLEDIVIRRMTYEHIPKDPSRKRRAKSIASEYAKINFPAFKHYAIIDGKITEVARSHWTGPEGVGVFNPELGSISNKLASMWLLFVQKFSSKARYRMYSYNEEMRGEAIIQLLKVGLQFDESKSSNPFSFYTTTVDNMFKLVKDSEKKIQENKDDLLIAAGASPSFTRQVEHEHSLRSERFYKTQNGEDIFSSDDIEYVSDEFDEDQENDLDSEFDTDFFTFA